MHFVVSWLDVEDLVVPYNFGIGAEERWFWLYCIVEGKIILWSYQTILSVEIEDLEKRLFRVFVYQCYSCGRPTFIDFISDGYIWVSSPSHKSVAWFLSSRHLSLEIPILSNVISSSLTFQFDIINNDTGWLFDTFDYQLVCSFHYFYIAPKDLRISAGRDKSAEFVRVPKDLCSSWLHVILVQRAILEREYEAGVLYIAHVC